MGKHLKTSMDYKIIDYLTIELHRLDPNNKVLGKFKQMNNHEGQTMSKTIKEFDKTGKYPEHYNTDSGYVKFDDFIKEAM
jgi:hypothetical protein|tara:strand:- start:151 stop:390 length:240 start_codon:yes stop_codon:yes gene_type:complete